MPSPTLVLGTGPAPHTTKAGAAGQAGRTFRVEVLGRVRHCWGVWWGTALGMTAGGRAVLGLGWAGSLRPCGHESPGSAHHHPWRQSNCLSHQQQQQRGEQQQERQQWQRQRVRQGQGQQERQG